MASMAQIQDYLERNLNITPADAAMHARSMETMTKRDEIADYAEFVLGMGPGDSWDAADDIMSLGTPAPGTPAPGTPAPGTPAPFDPSGLYRRLGHLEDDETDGIAGLVRGVGRAVKTGLLAIAVLVLLVGMGLAWRQFTPTNLESGLRSEFGEVTAGAQLALIKDDTTATRQSVEATLAVWDAATGKFALATNPRWSVARKGDVSGLATSSSIRGVKKVVDSTLAATRRIEKENTHRGRVRRAARRAARLKKAQARLAKAHEKKRAAAQAAVDKAEAELAEPRPVFTDELPQPTPEPTPQPDPAPEGDASLTVGSPTAVQG